MAENTSPQQPVSAKAQSPPSGGPQAPPSPPPAPPAWWPQPPAKHSLTRRIFMTIVVLVLALSVLTNIYLGAIIAADLAGGMVKTTIREGRENQTIALYDINGMIGGRAVEQFDRFCKEITNDDNVKAVVLRVSSPGGGVSASDQMYEMVRRLKEDAGKTVVVSMGGVAASGGYYISAAADEIVAEPTTITGSIGVIAGWPIIKGTLDKIGMEIVVMKSGNARGWKDERSLLQRPDEHQRAHLQQMLDSMQARFEKVVRAGRGERLRTREVPRIVRIGKGEKVTDKQITETEPFNGKIYRADEALELGMIDRVGYLDAAIAAAGELAGLDKPNVVRYRLRKSLVKQLLEARTGALDIGVSAIEELQTPRMMMIWRVE